MSLEPVFQASWTSQNFSLNPKSSITKSILNKLKNILLYLPNSLVAFCLNPRSATPIQIEDRKNETTSVSFVKVLTPDNVPLSLRIIKKLEGPENRPTIILFNPLGTNQDCYNNFVIKHLLKKNFSIVTFDYRGLGTTWRSNDLLVDGDSVYQYVTNIMHIDPKNIHFFGHSLGGAIASNVKALHQECSGKFVGDRTFLSLSAVIYEKFSLSRLGLIIKLITALIPLLLIALPLYLLGWNFSTKKALEKLQGKKLFIYHPNDCLVRPNASAARKGLGNEILQLDPHVRGGITHFAPIDQQTTSTSKNAADAVVEFLSES